MCDEVGVPRGEATPGSGGDPPLQNFLLDLGPVTGVLLGMDWFYGDPHFGHRNIVGLAGRPFADPAQMLTQMLHRYRERVRPRDTVCWLGDAFFGRVQDAQAVLSSLPGSKILVRGNHDGTVGRCLKMGFDMVVDRMHITVGGQRVMLCHFPPWGHHADDRFKERRPQLAPGEWLIHGHTHLPEKRRGRCINVCVEAWDYAPASLGDIASLIFPLV